MNSKHVVWSEYQGGDEGWNRLVKDKFGSPYQLSEWGEYKETSSWETFKVMAENDGEFVYAANILVKRYFFFAVCYIPSGGVGNTDILDEGFYHFIRHSIGVLYIYFRISFQQEYSDNKQRILFENCWREAKYQLGASHTMTYNLSYGDDERLLKASKNGRHNYKRSVKRDIVIHEASDSDTVIRILRDMESHKSLHTIFSDIEVYNILEKLRGILVLYYATNSSDVLLGMRGALISGSSAVDFIAATTSHGRKEYSSYALFWKLTSECKRRGVIRYDMGGVDETGNVGVYNFKKGTGAELLRYLGGYEWSGSMMSNLVVDVAVFVRNVRKSLSRRLSL